MQMSLARREEKDQTAWLSGNRSGKGGVVLWGVFTFYFLLR